MNNTLLVWSRIEDRKVVLSLETGQQFTFSQCAFWKKHKEAQKRVCTLLFGTLSKSRATRKAAFEELDKITDGYLSAVAEGRST